MNNKNKFRAGLSFGIAMAVFFVLRNLLTEDNQTSRQVIKAVVSGFLSGGISGLLFGWLTGLFSNSKLVKLTTRVDLPADELKVFETGANHFNGIEGVGGRLLLTNKRLIFTSHKLNIQNHQLSINLAEVANAEKYKTLGLVKNGLAISTRQNAKEKFVVESIDEWLKHLAKVTGDPLE